MRQFIVNDGQFIFEEERKSFARDFSDLAAANIVFVAVKNNGAIWVERDPFVGREQPTPEELDLIQAHLDAGQAWLDFQNQLQADEVPPEVTMRQARLALLQSNLLHLVDPAIDALPEPDKSAARIEWEYSQTVVRDKPFVQMLGAALGLTNEQIDDLFQLAKML